MKQIRKPYDASFIDFLMKQTPVDKLRLTMPMCKQFDGMARHEVRTLFWEALDVLENLKPFDPAYEHFYSQTKTMRQYLALKYLDENETYKENHFAILYPLLTRNVGNTRGALQEALDVYSLDTFKYTYTSNEIVIIPYPFHRRSKNLLEFMEVMFQFKISDGPCITDSFLWELL